MNKFEPGQRVRLVDDSFMQGYINWEQISNNRNNLVVDGTNIIGGNEHIRVVTPSGIAVGGWRKGRFVLATPFNKGDTVRVRYTSVRGVVLYAGMVYTTISSGTIIRTYRNEDLVNAPVITVGCKVKKETPGDRQITTFEVLFVYEKWALVVPELRTPSTVPHLTFTRGLSLV